MEYYAPSVTYRSCSSRGRRSWQPRGRGGRYNGAVQSDSVQMYQSTEPVGTQHAATAVDRSLSFSPVSDHNTARRPWRRGRGNRMPYNMPYSVRSASVSECNTTEQVEDCPSPFCLDASGRPLIVGLRQVSNIHAVGSYIVSNNCGENTSQHERGRFAHGNRGRFSSRQTSRQSRGRGGRYNHAIPSAHEEHDNVQMPQHTDLSVNAAAESCGTHHTVTTVSHCSTSLLVSDNNAGRRSWRRGRGNRRPWRAKGTNRPDSVSDCTSTQQVEEDCSSLSHVSSTADVGELIDVNSQQASNIHAMDTGRSTLTSCRAKNARQRGRGRFVHSGNRGRLSSKRPANKQIESENSETQCQVDSRPCETRLQDQTELELESNVETNEWVDDDGDDDGDDDVIKARNVPVASRGKQKNRNVRSAHGVRGNRRGFSRAGRFHDVLECEDTLISQPTLDAESVTSSVSPVQEAVIEQATDPTCKRSHRRQKKVKLKAASCQEICIVGNNASDSAAAAGKSEIDSAVKSPATSDVKQVPFGEHRKNSSSKPSSYMDENLLFWHLVNEHCGKCSLDELRNQLKTDDADNAIDVLRKSKRIKILVNESDKWMSVAFVFLKGLRVCLHVRAGCRNENCSFLHVCHDYITESCLAGQQCRFGHDARVPRNESCLQKCGIPDDCSCESILTIARCSNLIVCAGYNEAGELQCQNPVQCIRLHVCNSFFRNQCLIPNSKCVLGHELTSQHNARLLPLYQVKHLLTDDKLKTLHQMVLPFNTHTSYEKMSRMSQMMTAQQTNKPRSSASVAVVKPHARAGLHTDMKDTVTSSVAVVKPHARAGVQADMKDTVTPSHTLEDQLLAVTATEPSSTHQAKRPVTLRKFVYGPDQTSKTNSLPADNLGMLTADEHKYCSSSVSTKLWNKDDLTASGTSETKVTGDKTCKLHSDENDSDMKLTQVNEAVTTNEVPKFTSRRSQSTKTLAFNADQCQVYMKHSCNGSNDCTARHDSLPYLWRVQDARTWVAFDDNVSIEEAFCNPDNSSYNVLHKVCIHLFNCGIIFLVIKRKRCQGDEAEENK